MTDDVKKNKLLPRQEWIDFIRGFGMVLVIIGHSAIPNPYWTLIYIFHMPLFFFVSGLCYKNHPEQTLRKVCKKTFKKYIIPYILFSLSGFCLTVYLTRIFGACFSDQMLKYIIGIASARGEPTFTGNWGAIWFLTSQACLTLIVYIVEQLSNGNKAKTILLIALAQPINMALQRLLRTQWLPMNVGAALTGLPIFYLGYAYKKITDNKASNGIRTKLKRIKLIIALTGVVIAILGILIGCQNNNIVAFANNSYGNVWLMYLSSSLVLIGFTIMVETLYQCNLRKVIIAKVTEWIGKNTIDFLGLHGMTIAIIQTLLSPKWYNTAALTILIDSGIIILKSYLKDRKLEMEMNGLIASGPQNNCERTK